MAVSVLLSPARPRVAGAFRLSVPMAGRAEAFADLYARQLRHMDPELGVKSIGLRFSGLDRPAYQIFITTRDPDGALRLNDILRNASYRQHWTVWSDQQERDRRKRAVAPQFSMDFEEASFQSTPPEVELWKPDPADVVAALVGVVSVGEAVTYKKLKGRLINTLYTESEIRKALRALKGDGRARFTSTLAKDTRIEF